MKTKCILAVLIGAALLFSCQPAVLQGPAATPGQGSTQTGTMRITIPSVAPFVAKAFGLSRAAARAPATGRAILIATSVAFDLSLGETVVDHWTEVLNRGPTGGSANVTHEAYGGTGYTLRADIYNEAVSSVDPVVSGTSAPFDVIAGETTTVMIVCTPNAPADLTYEGASAGIGSGVFTVDEGGALILQSWGQDAWYRITRSGETVIRVSVDPDEASIAMFGLFDSQGNWKTMDVSGSMFAAMSGQGAGLVPGEPATAAFLCGSDDTAYYLGVITVSGSAITSSVSVTYEPVEYTDPGNHERAAAVELTQLTPVEGSNFSGGYRDPSNPDNTNGGDWYTFTTLTDGIATMRLDFDQSDVDLSLSLYGADGTFIQDFNESTPDRSYEEATLELSPETQYYLWVWQPPSMPTSGAPYTVQWAPGTGSLNILIQ
jgi:hypothetical protein